MAREINGGNQTYAHGRIHTESKGFKGIEQWNQ